GEVNQLVELPARVVGAAGCDDSQHGATGGQRLGKDAKVDVGDGVGEVHQLHADADNGLVRAVAGHGLGVGQARERTGQDGAVWHHLPGHAGHDALDGRDDVLLGYEAHLDVDLGVLRLPVSAQVLVTVGVGHLEVAVVA